MPKDFYLTTTLPYVNAPLHMGHALDDTLQDTLLRFKRMKGFEALWIPGTECNQDPSDIGLPSFDLERPVLSPGSLKKALSLHSQVTCETASSATDLL